MAIDEIESGEHMNEASEYRQAVQVIKEAILRSQYDAARSVVDAFRPCQKHEQESVKWLMQD